MAITQLANRVSDLATKHPGGPKDIELWAYKNLGLRVGVESFRKALHGEVDPTSCSVELLMALAAWYQVTPAELGHHAEERLAGVLAFAASQDEGPDTPPGQGFSDTAWNADVLAFRAREVRPLAVATFSQRIA